MATELCAWCPQHFFLLACQTSAHCLAKFKWPWKLVLGLGFWSCCAMTASHLVYAGWHGKQVTLCSLGSTRLLKVLRMKVMNQLWPTNNSLHHTQWSHHFVFCWFFWLMQALVSVNVPCLQPWDTNLRLAVKGTLVWGGFQSCRGRSALHQRAVPNCWCSLKISLCIDLATLKLGCFRCPLFNVTDP